MYPRSKSSRHGQSQFAYGEHRGQYSQQPYESEQHEMSLRRGRRGPGLIRRTARWLGETLQDWAHSGARQMERAGDRAREWSEEGGERASQMMRREESRFGGRRSMGWRGAMYGEEDYGGGGRMGGGYGRGRSHVARGPKGYKRSDDRIREDASEELARCWDLDPSEIELTVRDGEVTLKGTVEEREWKLIAEDVVSQVSGVRDVHNQLRVERHEERERKFAGNGPERQPPPQPH